MAALITKKKWSTVTHPFYYIKVDSEDWHIIHREIIVKWIEARCNDGWAYWDGDKTYVFESEQDRMLFKLWVTGDFSTEIGEV